MDREKEFEKKINDGNKKMGIVSSIIAAVLAIPTLVLVDKNQDMAYLYMLGYMGILIILMLFVSKIINRIWK